jgi:hypothetical protein
MPVVADSLAAMAVVGMLADCSAADMLCLVRLPGSESTNSPAAAVALEEWPPVCHSLGRNACFQEQNFRNLRRRAWWIVTFWFPFRNSSRKGMQLTYEKLNDCNIG